MPAEGNGDLQTLICILVARPRRCLTLSNPVPWQNWMAAYLGYTLRMKTLFCGWPIMVHDMHTRRRSDLEPSFNSVTAVKMINSHVISYFLVGLLKNTLLKKYCQYQHFSNNIFSTINVQLPTRSRVILVWKQTFAVCWTCFLQARCCRHSTSDVCVCCLASNGTNLSWTIMYGGQRSNPNSLL